MASNASCYVRFSDGTFASFRGTLTPATGKFGQYAELTTEGGDLNQTESVSAGQAFTNKVATHAFVKCATDSATTACYMSAWFELPNGQKTCIIEGGGANSAAMPALSKPVRFQTGLIIKAALQDEGDAAQIATLSVYCASGKVDVFAALAVDDVPTSMVNEQGATIGQALENEVIVGAIATYAATNGLDDNDGGVNALYVEDAAGTLKAMYPTEKGDGSRGVEWQRYPVRIRQNDTLTVTASL
jgi:hypothetical protein